MDSIIGNRIYPSPVDCLCKRRFGHLCIGSDISPFAYPLLGMKPGSYAYIVFGTLVIMTTVYGMENWAFIFPVATIFNISVTLIVGGGIIFYFEYTKELVLPVLPNLSAFARILSSYDQLRECAAERAMSTWLHDDCCVHIRCA